MNKEVLLDALQNREFLYRFLWRFYTNYADEEFLNLIVSDVTQKQFEIYLSDDAQGLRLLELLRSEVNEKLQPNEATLDRLKTEFTKLFEMGSLPAHPWESVYTNPHELMFTLETLDVRYAMAENGYGAAGSPRQADDHISVELDYMAALTKDSITALNEGNAECAAYLLEQQLKFLQKHLNLWVEKFATKMSNEAKGVSDFYPLGAALTAAVCRNDEAVVTDLLAYMQAE